MKMVPTAMEMHNELKEALAQSNVDVGNLPGPQVQNFCENTCQRFAQQPERGMTV